MITEDNKTVYKLKYRKKKVKRSSPNGKEEETAVSEHNKYPQKKHIEESKNTSSIEFPEVYTHDGETYL